MAVVGFQDVPAEWYGLLNKAITPLGRQTSGAIRYSGKLTPEKKRFDVPNRSLLPQVAESWRALSAPERADWIEAGTQTNMNGWNLFTQDTCYRIKYGKTGIAIPSNIHQYKVGRLEVDAPASQASIIQHHPNVWFIFKKVQGTKSQYYEQRIEERLQLPLQIGLSYRTDFSSTGGGSYVKFYALITSHYQGQDIETELAIDLPLTADWTRETATSNEVLGVARWYDLRIDCYNVRGVIEFDNLQSLHTGTNFGRDIRCNNVNTPLSNIYFQIGKAWEENILPAGAGFDSVYPADEGDPWS